MLARQDDVRRTTVGVFQATTQFVDDVIDELQDLLDDLVMSVRTCEIDSYTCNDGSSCTDT